MSRTVKALRALSIDQLIEAHDRAAQHTAVGVSYYLEELARRESRGQTAIIVRLTWAIFALTLVVAGATVALLLRG